MRIEDAGGRTWLIAAVALWAVCVWILAVAGLGGKVQQLEEDPALLQPLPRGAEAAERRLGPLPQYAQIVDRPLFAHDRQHRPFFLEPEAGEEAGVGDFDVVLTSVLIDPRLEMAIVQPRDGDGGALRFRLGESVPEAPGWTLTSLDPRSATFNGPEGERTLQLRAFDGTDGEPPTPIGVGAPEPAAPADAPAAENTPAEQAEAIRRRIEERRARVREQRSQSQSATQQRNP